MIAGRGLFGPLEQFRLGRTKELSLPEAEILRERVLSEKIPSLSSVVRVGGAVSHDVVRLTDWMLSRDPAMRPQSLDDLSRVLAALPESAIAPPAHVSHFVQRLLRATFEQRDQLVAEALKPSQPPPMDLGLEEARTVPRSLALAARLAQEVPSVEDEAPPAAVVPIQTSGKAPARWDGILAAAAAILLAISLGGYLMAARATARQAAVEPDALAIDLQDPPPPHVRAETVRSPEPARPLPPSEQASARVPASSSTNSNQEKSVQQTRRSGGVKAAPKPMPGSDSVRGGYRPSGI
jgi:hypothetical protein